MDRSKVLCFPPFVCLLRVIWEIWQDGAEGIIIVPDCANQLSLSQFCNMITKDVVFPPRQDLLLSSADPNISHSLHQTLQLRAATVSGKLQKPHTTQKECKTYSWHLGHPKHKTIIIPTFKRVVLNFAPTQSHPVPYTPTHSLPLQFSSNHSHPRTKSWKIYTVVRKTHMKISVWQSLKTNLISMLNFLHWKESGKVVAQVSMISFWNTERESLKIASLHQLEIVRTFLACFTRTI